MFLVIFFIGEEALAFLLDVAVLRSRIRYSLLYSGDAATDVLILGDSRAAVAFDPIRLEQAAGLTAFNLSHNHMSTDIMAVLFRDYLEHNTAPKVVVLELSSTLLDPEHSIQGLRMYARHSKRLGALLEQYEPLNLRISRIFRLFAFNSEMFLRALYFLDRDDQGWCRGETMSRASIDALKAPGEMKLGQPTEASLQAVAEIVALAREQGIRCVLVITPFLPQYRESIVGYGKWVDRLREVAGDELIYDYSAAFADESLFADKWHLNCRGSSEFADLMQGVLRVERPQGSAHAQ